MAKGTGTITVIETFDPPYLFQDGVALTRGIFRKRFTGTLVGTSEAQVLRATTAIDGDLGFVGLEWFSGSVGGQSGSVALVHAVVEDDGKQTQRIALVPNSGTGGLAGIRGTMSIVDDADSHTYTVDYRLP
jgi:hypothetical protein